MKKTLDISDSESKKPKHMAARLSVYRRYHDKLRARGDEVRWVYTALRLGREFERTLRIWSVLGGLTGLTRAQAAFIENGNKAVFQDAKKRIDALLEGDVLTGEAALEWDRYILEYEQSRLQSLYVKLGEQPQELQAFEQRLQQPPMMLRTLLPTLTSAPFRGSLLNTKDRISFGLRMMYPERFQ